MKNPPAQNAISVSKKTLDETTRELFAPIPQVESIYHASDEEGITFWIFTSNQNYDDALMELLISKEQEVMDTFPQEFVLFRFVPSILCPEPHEVTGITASLLFTR